MSSSQLARPSKDRTGEQHGISALESLARAARQVSVFGREHPIAVTALKRACQDLVSELGGETLELRAEEGGLFWRGEPLPAKLGPVPRLRQAMRDRVIAAIGISPEVQPEELVELLDLLAEDVEALAESGGATAWLSRKDVTGVWVEDVDFHQELRESESAWLDAWDEVEPETLRSLTEIVRSCLRTSMRSGSVPSLQDSEGAVEGAGQTDNGAGDMTTQPEDHRERIATAVAMLLQRAGSAARSAGGHQWRAWRRAMAGAVARLSPEWRALVFRGQTNAATPGEDMLAVIAAELSPTLCVSLVLDHPEAIRLERSEDLGRVLRRIMPSPARAAVITPVLRDAAIARGHPAEVYRNVVEVLMSEIPRSQGGRETTEREETSPGAEPSAAVSEELADLLATTNTEVIRRAMIGTLKELLAQKVTDTQYGAALDALTESAQRCADLEDDGLLMEVLWTLRDQTCGEEEEHSLRRSMATHAIARAGSAAVVRRVARRLATAPADEQDDLIALLGLLGERGLDALTVLAMTGEEGQRDRAFRAVAENGEAGFSHLRDILLQASQDALPRMLHSLIGMGKPELIEQIASVADHLGVEARLMLAEMAAESGKGELHPIVLRLLPDETAEVRVAAARAAGRMKSRQAVPALCRLVQRESRFFSGGPVREAAVRALGDIGSPECVPVLQGLLNAGPWRRLLVGARLREAAAEALGKIAGQTSERAARDHHGVATMTSTDTSNDFGRESAYDR